MGTYGGLQGNLRFAEGRNISIPIVAGLALFRLTFLTPLE